MKKSLSVQSAWYFSGRLIALVFSIFIPIILVRVFSKEEYGAYAQILLIYAFFLRILQFGFKQSVLYFIPKYPELKKQIISNTTIFFLILGTINILFFYFFKDNIGKVFSFNEVSNLLPLCGIYILFMLLLIQ